MIKQKNKKAQVWVETVIYTLIGLVLIGTVLAFATPVIQKQQDKATIDRTVSAINELDNGLTNIKNAGVSNARVIDFLISEGSLTIDGVDNTISFQIDGIRYAYSEIRTTVDISGTNIKARTVEQGNNFGTTLTIDYDGKVDLTYLGDDKVITLGASPNSYRLIIENLGKVPIPLDLPDDCDPTIPDDSGCANAGHTNHECIAGPRCKPLLININIYDAS